jgi:hypothetical protein
LRRVRWRREREARTVRGRDMPINRIHALNFSGGISHTLAGNAFYHIEINQHLFCTPFL